MKNWGLCSQVIGSSQGSLCLDRRQFLQRSGTGFGLLSLAGLLDGRNTVRAAATTRPSSEAFFQAKAKRVIYIFAQGAPSQVDTWDPKPELTRRADQSLPGLGGVAMASPFTFARHGQSGIEVSQVFPKLAAHVDKMAVIRSMHTDIPAHDVATLFMNTGSLRMTKPSIGSWVLYGLGAENENIPGYVSLRPGGIPAGGVQNWGSAFLPGNFQAASVSTRSARVEDMLQNIKNPYITRTEQRRQLDLAQKLNATRAAAMQQDAQLEARIAAFEMAYRMQMEATDAFDITKEPASVRELYGDSAQGRQLLIARRLAERGVRFIQVWAGGWDHHEDLQNRLSDSAQEIDQPAAALLADLAQRGMLDSTLVVWGGEFGRTVTRDRNGGDDPGRDHNNRAFALWLAGGGVKGGTVHGATDEFGARAVQDKVHVHDLHATLLHLLGMNHEKLTYRYNGRDFRLTDNFGNVVKNILS
ncbi:MAG: DUF1501 domain-containing protein [Verrucomicrobia bacterium]|nr:DUF1501 domain-containing protein [Verrucomicrobiota bacterium]